MKILKPNHLNKGDEIGVVAPSFPFPTDKTNLGSYMNQYLDGKSELEKMGFQVAASQAAFQGQAFLQKAWPF